MTRIKPNSIIYLFLIILSTTIVPLGTPMTPDAVIASSDHWPVGTFVVKVNGDASPNQFTIKIVSPGGGTATPESFSDDGTGTPVTLSGGGTFEMAPNTEPGYTRSLGNDCVDAFTSPSLPQRFECTITFTQIGLVEEEPVSSAPAPATSKEMPLAEQMPQMSTPPPSPPPPPPASVSESLPSSPQQKPGTELICDNNGNGLLDTEEHGCLAQLCATVTGKLVLADPSICDKVLRQQLPQPGSTTAQPQAAPPSPFTEPQPQAAPPSPAETPPAPPPPSPAATESPTPPPTDGTATTTQPPTPPPATTPGSSSLNASIVVVKLNVINEHGGTRNANEFLIKVLGNDPKPIIFQGSPSETIVSVKPGFYSVGEFVTEDTDRYERPWGYGNFAYTSGCKGEIKEGQTRTCTIYVADSPYFPWSDPGLSRKGGFK